MRTTVKMALQERRNLLQDTNPVRLQPSADTVTNKADPKPASTHLSKKDNFANGTAV